MERVDASKSTDSFRHVVEQASSVDKRHTREQSSGRLQMRFLRRNLSSEEESEPRREKSPSHHIEIKLYRKIDKLEKAKPNLLKKIFMEIDRLLKAKQKSMC